MINGTLGQSLAALEFIKNNKKIVDKNRTNNSLTEDQKMRRIAQLIAKALLEAFMKTILINGTNVGYKKLPSRVFGLLGHSLGF